MIFRRRLAPDESYPAGEPGITARWITTRAGTRVRVVEAAAAGGDGEERRTALLIHGWGCHAYVFRHLIPALAGAGYHVVAPDLKGHGQSDKPGDPAGYTLDAMADHATQIMDALGLPRADVLVGHSLGGAVALRLTMRAAARVGRLVLFAPVGLGKVSAYRLGRAATPRALTPLLPSLAPRWLFRLVMMGAYGRDHRFTERDVDEYWGPTRTRDFVPALRHLLHAFDWSPRDPRELRSLAVPTLVVFGREDRVVSPRESERYVAEIPDARLEMVARAGHVVPEELPDRAAALTLEFVALDGAAP